MHIETVATRADLPAASADGEFRWVTSEARLWSYSSGFGRWWCAYVDPGIRGLQVETHPVV